MSRHSLDSLDLPSQFLDPALSKELDPKSSVGGSFLCNTCLNLLILRKSFSSINSFQLLVVPDFLPWHKQMPFRHARHVAEEFFHVLLATTCNSHLSGLLVVEPWEHIRKKLSEGLNQMKSLLSTALGR